MKEPRSEKLRAGQSAAQEPSELDYTPAGSSVAAETRISYTDGESDNRGPAESGQEVAESHELKSLWDGAYSRLQDKHPKQMDAYQKDLLASDSQISANAKVQLSANCARGEARAQQLENLVKNKLDAIQKAQLTVTVGGEAIIVKDQVRKVVHTILSFKDFIGTAISAEPHAALAWAGVVIILPVSVVPVVLPLFDVDSYLKVAIEPGNTGRRRY